MDEREQRRLALAEMLVVALPASLFMLVLLRFAAPLTVKALEGAWVEPGVFGLVAAYWAGVLGLCALWRVLVDRQRGVTTPFSNASRWFVTVSMLAGFLSATPMFVLLLRKSVFLFDGAFLYVTLGTLAVGLHQLPYTLRRICSRGLSS